MSLSAMRWFCFGYLVRVVMEPLIPIPGDTSWPHRAAAGVAGWIAIEAALYVGVRVRRAYWRRRVIGGAA